MYDVIKHYEKNDPAIIEGYRQIGESASILESMPHKDGALHSRIHAVWKGARACGNALTVVCGIGDNVMLHKAISMAGPDDVLVAVNGFHDEAGGMFGEMMATSLKARGAAGIVMEFCNRDSVAIEEMRFPVFSTGLSIKATTKCCPGLINHPIVIGGVRVCPGDLVFADQDGVVVVPRADASAVLDVARAREQREQEMRENHILKGEYTTFKMFEKNYLALGLSEEE